MGFTVCLRLRVTGRQLGMSAGRNLIECKSEPREVWRRLEPNISDGASAEEEGIDRFVVYIAVGSTEMQHHCLFEALSHISCISATNAFS